MTYRKRLDRATKHAQAAARQRGAAIPWTLARIRGQMWLTLCGVYPPAGTGFLR